MKKYRKNKDAYALYLGSIAVILAVLYYAVNNFILSKFFNSSTVSWLEAAVFAAIITFIYEFVLPRISKRHDRKVDEK